MEGASTHPMRGHRRTELSLPDHMLGIACATAARTRYGLMARWSATLPARSSTSPGSCRI